MQRSTTTTGIDFQTDSHASDIEAFIDDGEHAVVWGLKRITDDTADEDGIEITVSYWHAGLRDEIVTYVVTDDRPVPDYARAELLPHADEAMAECRDHWRNDD